MSGRSPILNYASQVTPAAEELDQHEEINNGRLNDPLDANGFPINDAGVISYTAAAVTALGQAKDVYIGIRTDGRLGSGLATDPYDGSTAEKLDTLFPAIGANTEINFAKGTFQTLAGLTAKLGQIIRGAGKNLTTIQAAPNVITTAGQSFSVLTSAPLAGHIEVRDLTLDGNRENQSAFVEGEDGDITDTLNNTAMNVFFITAYSALVDNVRVTGAWAKPGEGFPYIVQHLRDGDATEHPEDVIRVTNSECISTRGYAAGIGVFDQSGTGRFYAQIRACLIYDSPDGVGLGCTGCMGADVSENIIVNVGRVGSSTPSIQFDTWSNRGMAIHDNKIFGGAYGINFYSGSPNKNLRIYGNHIETDGNCIQGAAIDLDDGATSVYIHDNYLKVARETGFPIGIADNMAGEIHNNVVTQPAGLIPFYFWNYKLIRIWDNVTEEGKPTALFTRHIHRQTYRQSFFYDGSDGSLVSDGLLVLGEINTYEPRALMLEVFIEGNNLQRVGIIEILVRSFADIKWFHHPGGTLSGNGEVIILTHTTGTVTSLVLRYAGSITTGLMYANLISGWPLDPTAVTGWDVQLPPLGTLAIAPISDSPTVYVDKAFGNSDTAARLDPSRPFPTIQEALDAAEDGDEIIVAKGIYDETVTVKAGTYVITQQHGAIWKQTNDAACLVGDNVTCDFTINGDLYTEDDGAACIAIQAGCPNVTIRINGKQHALGTGTAYTVPCGSYHDDGNLHINGDIIVGATQAGLVSISPASTAVLEMTGDCNATLFAVALLGTNGTATFRNCEFRSSTTEVVSVDGRDLHFTRSTLRATGALSSIVVGGSAQVTLHEFCHLLSGPSATELSTGGLVSIVLDGLSFTNKPKEVGTSLAGDGYFVVGGSASTGVITLT